MNTLFLYQRLLAIILFLLFLDSDLAFLMASLPLIMPVKIKLSEFENRVGSHIPPHRRRLLALSLFKEYQAFRLSFLPHLSFHSSSSSGVEPYPYDSITLKTLAHRKAVRDA